MQSPTLYLFLLVGLSAVLAAPPEIAKPKCPPSSIELHLLSNGKKYYFHTPWVTYDEAKGFCESNNMRLPIIETIDELDVVLARANTTVGVSWWVDASDIGQEPGHFRWGNGQELPRNSSLWQEEQPNSFGPGKKTCVFYSSFFGKHLFDTICDDIYWAVCQADQGC
ncbi:alpha-N-acetylgalactosamine-specific lectin-like [Cloeon dipterum]|uniref:alpha-N-acetylgalactosamine-specific lectin-like n=1 Tax=Cloeon dipterum TaxID=197152 RepID=UPI00322088B0